MRIEPHPAQPAHLQVPGPEHPPAREEETGIGPTGRGKRPAVRGLDEHLRLVWQRRRLEDRVPGARPVPLEPELRLTLKETIEERRLPKSAKSALDLAALYGPEKGPRAGLVQVLQHPGFARLTHPAAAAFLAAWGASHLATTREYLRLLGGPFIELSQSVQILALQRMSGNELAVRRLAQLLQLSGFGALPPSCQIDLLNVASGPRTAGQITRHRKNQLYLGWSKKMTALDRLLRKRSFASGPAAIQAEELTRFLGEQSEDVWLLSATHTNGHSVIVLGDPADRQSISYGHRWVLSSGGTPVARIFNPDPTVRSGWTKPSGQSDVVYVFERRRITRPQLWGFVCWIEQSASITSDAREHGLGPTPSTGRASSFWEASREALALLAPGAKEHAEGGYARRGVPTAPAQPRQPAPRPQGEASCR